MPSTNQASDRSLMPKRYRVAIITRTFPPKRGGIASAHYNLYKLLQRDHDVRAFAFDDDDASPHPDVVRRKSSRLLRMPVQAFFSQYVRRYDKTHPAVYCRALAAVLPAARALSRPLRQFRPDIVIIPDNFVPGLALKIPPNASVIWMSRNNFKRFEGQPLIDKRSWMDIHLAHRMELRALRKADFVVCPSYYMKHVFEETYPVDLPIEVIYNFVESGTLENVRPSDLREKLGIDERYRLIYLPSAGTANKGKRYTFELIRRLGATERVAFYISGPIPPDLARELASLPETISVYAPGQVAYTDNLRHVAACDFAISPTLIENLSNAIVEGLMLDVPFVTFDTGGNKEIIRCGINGVIVPYIDVEALVARSAELIENPEMLSRFKANCRTPLRSILDSDRLRAQYQAVFDRLRSKAA